MGGLDSRRSAVLHCTIPARRTWLSIVAPRFLVLPRSCWQAAGEILRPRAMATRCSLQRPPVAHLPGPRAIPTMRLLAQRIATGPIAESRLQPAPCEDQAASCSGWRAVPPGLFLIWICAPPAPNAILPCGYSPTDRLPAPEMAEVSSIRRTTLRFHLASNSRTVCTPRRTHTMPLDGPAHQGEVAHRRETCRLCSSNPSQRTRRFRGRFPGVRPRKLRIVSHIQFAIIPTTDDAGEAGNHFSTPRAGPLMTRHAQPRAPGQRSVPGCSCPWGAGTTGAGPTAACGLPGCATWRTRRAGPQSPAQSRAFWCSAAPICASKPGRVGGVSLSDSYTARAFWSSWVVRYSARLYSCVPWALFHRGRHGQGQPGALVDLSEKSPTFWPVSSTMKPL